MNNTTLTNMSWLNDTTNATEANRTYFDMETGVRGVIVPVIFASIILVGVAGNILVMVVLLCKKEHIQNTTNIFILNLSIADLLFLIFCGPFQTYLFSGDSWIFGTFLCKFVHYGNYTNMIASIYNLLVMSVDRYIAIVHAIKSREIRNPRYAWIVESVIWSMSLLMAIPIAIAYKTESAGGYTRDEQEVLVCMDSWNTWSERVSYFTTLFVCCYVIPLLCISLCYILLVRSLQDRPRHGQQNTKKKVTKMVTVVVIMFAVCWFPHWMILMWNMYADFPFTMATFVLRMLANTLMYLNSCCNPFIYAFMSKNFRKGFHKAVTGKLSSFSFRKKSVHNPGNEDDTELQNNIPLKRSYLGVNQPDNGVTGSTEVDAASLKNGLLNNGHTRT
ncbi:GALR2 [Branchiostoma lanceolatum]|uniref:GALR2 protein n=1 Tax=Branchiostoma lanceolatum TaxID=7740 RepID=A0A8K0A495_BRALA|nr:GALR2 [Branchiostoma lanceolatum]